MQRKMTSYAKGMSGNDINLLYDVVCKKYKEFKEFYRLVEFFSDKIRSLKYEFTSDTDLKVNLNIEDGINTKEVFNNILGRVESSVFPYDCDVKQDKNKIKIRISSK